MNRGVFFLLAITIGMFSCKKEYVNPYDQVEVKDPVDTLDIELTPTSIAGLHANIFAPTCANSGCHDGTFEPDYRTIESTYNTLVYQPIIKNDPNGTYEYRVLPGNAEGSQLMARLTFDIDDNSGIMPLVIEPESDWPDKKQEYIQNIRDWINDGAKDILGNSPGLSNNSLPQMEGVVGRGENWLGREDGGQGALRFPKTWDEIELFFSFSDDDTDPSQFGNNKIQLSRTADGFASIAEFNLEVLSSPISRTGYYGEEVNYTHRAVFNPNDFAELEEIIYFRVYVSDSGNPVTEIPAEGGAFYIKDYFSFTIIE